MAPRKKAGITGSGGTNVDPLYNRSFPPTYSLPPSKWKPTIPEPDLRPGGKLNPTFRPGVKDPMPRPTFKK